VYKILVGRSEERRVFGIPQCRMKVANKTNFKQMGNTIVE
jgi:hypothetical protein